MRSDFSEIIDRFQGLSVLVVGDAMIDTYLEGNANGLSSEGPAPVVDVVSRSEIPGGAASLAANLAALSAKATLLSVIGDDPDGATLCSRLEHSGVATVNVFRHVARHTLAKRRIVAGGHLLVRVDEGTVDPIDEVTEQWVIDQLSELFDQHDAVVVCDADCGVMTPRVIAHLHAIRAARKSMLVVDAKDVLGYRLMQPTVVKSTWEQSMTILGRDSAVHPDDHAAALAEAQGTILTLTGARMVAVTLESEGALLLTDDMPAYRDHARPSGPSLTAGAEDAFTAVLTLSMGAQADPRSALQLASTAAAIVARDGGIGACTDDALRAGTAVLPEEPAPETAGFPHMVEPEMAGSKAD